MCAHESAIYLNGACKTCDQERHERYARRRKDGIAIIKTAEARGLSATEALNIIANADVRVLRMFEEYDPELVRIARERLT